MRQERLITSLISRADNGTDSRVRKMQSKDILDRMEEYTV